MSVAFQEIFQKYAKEPTKPMFYNLKLINQFMEMHANDFFVSMRKVLTNKQLPISNILLENYEVLATNPSKQYSYAFRKMIIDDFEKSLHPKFLYGFIQVVQRRINQLRREEKQQYRGIVLTFFDYLEEEKSKNDSCYDRPVLLRLDYSIAYQKIELPLNGYNGLSEAILFAYTFSSIKKESFTNYEIISNINKHYELLNHQNAAVAPSDLIDIVLNSKWFKLEKPSFIQKDISKEKLVYEAKPSGESLPFLSKIRLVLTYTKWEDGYACFGTGFFINDQAVITSSKNLIFKEDKFSLVSFEVCLHPFQEERKWIKIQKTQIKNFSHSSVALVILPPTARVQEKISIKIKDCSKGLPAKECYVYGFQFQKKGGKLKFRSQLSRQLFESCITFDSFYGIKSMNSSGSLVFFNSQNKPTVFGVYNPCSKGVFNFNLIHDPLTEQIQEAIQTIGHLPKEKIIQDSYQYKKILPLPQSAVGMVYASCQLYAQSKYSKNISKNKYKLKYRLGEYGSGPQSTGAFIGEKIILSCAHNFLSRVQYESSYTMIVTKVHFYPGLSKQHNESQLSEVLDKKNKYPFYTIPIENVYIRKTYFNNYSLLNPLHITSDIAILFLEKQTHLHSLRIGKLPQNEQNFWNDKQLVIYGYPGYSMGTLIVEKGKRITVTEYNQILKDTLFYEANTSVGFSGSPVFVQSIGKPNQLLEIIAVHTYDHANRFKSANQLIGQNLRFINGMISKTQQQKYSLKQCYDQLTK